MVAGVTSSATIFSTSSPFVVTGSEETRPAPKTESTVLTPSADPSKTADIANVFSPPASISQLTPLTANVVLTQQAREKPIILQDPNPPLDNSSLGNLDLFDELLNESLTVRPSDDNNDDKDEASSEDSGTTGFTTQEPHTPIIPVDDNSSQAPSLSSQLTAATAAYETAQNQSAPQQSYATSAVDISA